jgi:hypothetical protein
MPTGGGPAPCIDVRRYQIASLIGGDGLSAALIGAETNPYNNPYILVRSSAMQLTAGPTRGDEITRRAAGRRLGKGTWIVQPLGMRMPRIRLPPTRISGRR